MNERRDLVGADVDELEAYRQWGVPDYLLPYTTHVFGTQLPPQVLLPDGWKRWRTPSIRRVRSALDLGMGLVVNDLSTFDFRWLGSSIRRATSIECNVRADALAGYDALTSAIAMRLLSFPKIEEAIDLSALPSLEWALVGGSGMLSAARAPRVRVVAVSDLDDVPKDRLNELTLSPDVVELSVQGGVLDLERILPQVPRLESLTLTDATTWDLESVRHVRDLQKLLIERAGRVDLSSMAGLARLRVLSLNTVREITGLAALRECTSLRDLDFFRVGRMDNRDALLELELDEFSGVGAIFDADFAATAARKAGNWYVEFPKARKPRT